MCIRDREGGHRVGIAGQMGCDGGKVTAVSEIASLNIRIAHQIRDVAMPVSYTHLDVYKRQGHVI